MKWKINSQDLRTKGQSQVDSF